MKAQLARFLISLASLSVGGVVFLLGSGWMAVAASIVTVLAGFAAAEITFRRFADRETLQRDLAERLRNQHL